MPQNVESIFIQSFIKLSGSCVDVITHQVRRSIFLKRLGNAFDKPIQNYSRFFLKGNFRTISIIHVMNIMKRI